MRGNRANYVRPRKGLAVKSTLKSARGETETDPVASLLFPGRKKLYAREIAARLSVTQQHVINLVKKGELTAAGKQITAESYAAFLRRRSNVGGPE